MPYGITGHTSWTRTSSESYKQAVNEQEGVSVRTIRIATKNWTAIESLHTFLSIHSRFLTRTVAALVLHCAEEEQPQSEKGKLVRHFYAAQDSAKMAG